MLFVFKCIWISLSRTWMSATSNFPFHPFSSHILDPFSSHTHPKLLSVSFVLICRWKIWLNLYQNCHTAQVVWKGGTICYWTHIWLMCVLKNNTCLFYLNSITLKLTIFIIPCVHLTLSPSNPQKHVNEKAGVTGQQAFKTRDHGHTSWQVNKQEKRGSRPKQVHWRNTELEDRFKYRGANWGIGIRCDGLVGTDQQTEDIW